MKASTIRSHIAHVIHTSTMRQKIRTIWFTLVFLFFCWMIYSYQATGLPEKVMDSTSQIAVLDTEEYISFLPTTTHHHQAYIFYPGALVAPKAYAPYARAIAKQGYPTIIVKMPFRMASFQPDKALLVMQQYKRIENWVIGGHSLGGAKAAHFAFSHPERVVGLLLLGTSHPRDVNMATLPIAVTKIYGSNDGLASVKEIKQFKKNLPPHTLYVEIPGGNHAQFGWYGSQLGDSPAAITRKMQQALVVEATLAMLHRLTKVP